MKYQPYLFFFCIVLIVGCAARPEFAVIKSSPTTKYKWNPEWNKFIGDEVKRQKATFLVDSIVPKEDVTELCPGYFSATKDQKVAFWTLVVISMAKFESNFNPNDRFREGASLKYVYSEGLLQLSYIDAVHHKELKLPIDSVKQNIFDPKANLVSGVRILAKQLQKKKGLFTARSYYWSVLTKKKPEIIQFFQANAGQFGFCK